MTDIGSDSYPGDSGGENRTHPSGDYSPPPSDTNVLVESRFRKCTIILSLFLSVVSVGISVFFLWVAIKSYENVSKLYFRDNLVKNIIVKLTVSEEEGGSTVYPLYFMADEFGSPKSFNNLNNPKDVDDYRFDLNIINSGTINPDIHKISVKLLVNFRDNKVNFTQQNLKKLTPTERSTEIKKLFETNNDLHKKINNQTFMVFVSLEND